MSGVPPSDGAVHLNAIAFELWLIIVIPVGASGIFAAITVSAADLLPSPTSLKAATEIS